ncbi:hypothetical protein BDW74DRAFT_116111 [Aspergillus multicolor]|uniref:uncharacterized protein n=1 Tax=Aspergillus multicolor TaxID=41759 RepID=UPI003CCE07D1
MERGNIQRVPQPNARTWSYAQAWAIGCLRWLYENVVDTTFLLIWCLSVINMTLLFVAKYRPGTRPVVDVLMYITNAFAFLYFLLVGIALRALGPPAERVGFQGFTNTDEEETIKPHSRRNQCMFVALVIFGGCIILSIYVLDRMNPMPRKQAVWLIWVLLVAICVKAWAMGEIVEMLAGILSSRVVANLYFISFGNSVDGVFMFEAYLQEKYALAINNVWLNIAIMLTSLGVLCLYATVLESYRKPKTCDAQVTDPERQLSPHTLGFYQLKGDRWAKAALFVLLMAVLIVIALGTDAYSDMGTEVFNSFGHWPSSFFENFLAPAICIIPEKAAFLVQISKDPQGAVGPVVEGIKESASQIGLLFWFPLLAALLAQGHQASLYANPWPALMVFLMTSLLLFLRLENLKWWKGALVSLVGLSMLLLSVYRGYLIRTDPFWADYV